MLFVFTNGKSMTFLVTVTITFILDKRQEIRKHVKERHLYVSIQEISKFYTVRTIGIVLTFKMQNL